MLLKIDYKQAAIIEQGESHIILDTDKLTAGLWLVTVPGHTAEDWQENEPRKAGYLPSLWGTDRIRESSGLKGERMATKELLEELGLSAAIVALEAGESWQYAPESVEEGRWNPYYCGDCKAWHQEWIATGYELDGDGTLYLTVWSCDPDGNWRVDDEQVVSFVSDVEDVEAEIVRDCGAATLDYYRHVARYGSDPLHEFAVRETIRVATKWQIKLSPSILGWVLLGARRAGRGEWTTDLPDYVNRYLSLNTKGGRLIVSDLDGMNADEVLVLRTIRWQRGYFKGMVEIKHEVARGPLAVRSELQRRARQAIKGMSR